MVFENKYQKIYWKDGVLIQEWLPETKFLKNEDFKRQMLQYRNVLLNEKPETILVDTRNLLFVVPPEMQVWINTEVNKPISQYVRKAAFLVSSDYLTKFSVEMTLEQQEFFTVKYFTTASEAIKWLKAE